MKPLGLLGEDPKDERDLEYKDYRPLLSLDKIPQSFDKMLKWKTGVSDQHYGSCTSHGSNNCKESQETKETGNKFEGSPKYIYHFTKVISGLWNNQGDYSRNAAKAVEKYGVPKLSTYPDGPEENWEEYVRPKPPQKVIEEAKIRRIESYAKEWPRIRAFQSAILREETPISTAMKWHRSYYSIGNDGILPDPKDPVGGHNVAVVTWLYDKKRDEPYWVVKNSHGTDFGDIGYFYIPFSQWDKHTIWHGWIYTDIDNSKVKNMFKLVRHPDRQYEVFAVKGKGKYHIANLYTLWRGSELNPRTNLALWKWEQGDKIPVANVDEWSNLIEGNEIALLPPDKNVDTNESFLATTYLRDSGTHT